jgi:predicted deacylase
LDDDAVRVLDERLDLQALGPGRHRLARTVARMADGGTIRLPVNVLRGSVPGPRLVAIGGVHGDEHDGPAALLDAFDELADAELAGTLVFVPVANPPAFRAVRRWNPADGVNMNRIFPADPHGSITHRLAHILVDEVIRGADFVLTIHGWTTGSLTVPYVEYTADHPTSGAARAGAAAFGLEYLEPLPLLPGRLMSHVAEVGMPACEVEIGGEGITLPERAAIGRRGVTGVLRHLGILAGPAERPARQRDVVRHEVVAPAGGALRRAPAPRVGDRVTAGEPIARICGLNGEPLVDLRAPASGVLAMCRHALPVEPGDLVAAVFADAGPDTPRPAYRP